MTTNLQTVWSRLHSIRELVFQSESRAPANTGWIGSGKGNVAVEQVDSEVVVFHERGSWTPAEGRPTAFTNTYRWTADSQWQYLRLEHLRFGNDRPVYLFDLVSVNEDTLESSQAHVCSEDLYTARMKLDDESIRLTWSICGPTMSETISYVYR